MADLIMDDRILPVLSAKSLSVPTSGIEMLSQLPTQGAPEIAGAA